MIAACAAASQLDKAVELYREMCKVTYPHRGCHSPSLGYVSTSRVSCMALSLGDKDYHSPCPPPPRCSSYKSHQWR